MVTPSGLAEEAAAAAMAEYVECMDEITRRSRFVQDFYGLSVDRFPLPVVAETVGLQMRKILELIAKASLAAHRAAWDEASLWFKRDWNAKAILERIEKVNPRFYPHPVKESQVFASGPLKAEWEDVPEDIYLTKGRFIDAYDAIGKMMHAHLPGESVDYGGFLLRTRAWDEQIHELLAMHQVFLLGVPDAFFLVQMNVDGRPTWSQWAKIESGEPPQIL
ncbi:MAG: hypothetical protein F4Y05_05510 [Acidimicrobiaceae bacterium]|nr:hypothetical protein [Acidimicrobiaceae bacterium]MYE09043.1 hypothetical protein [Acidimicrobiaceae bacterium]